MITEVHFYQQKKKAISETFFSEEKRHIDTHTQPHDLKTISKMILGSH